METSRVQYKEITLAIVEGSASSGPGTDTVNWV